MRAIGVLAVALALAGTAVWADARALDGRSPTHDDRAPALDVVPAAVAATAADLRPASSVLPLVALGAAAVLVLAGLGRGVPSLERASLSVSRRLVRAGRRAPPLASRDVVRSTF
jgi:hypothetical protein